MPSISECGSVIISGSVPAGARLALVGVDHDVVRLAVVLRDELPLHAGREAGAAAAAQAGVLDHVMTSSGVIVVSALRRPW